MKRQTRRTEASESLLPLVDSLFGLNGAGAVIAFVFLINMGHITPSTAPNIDNVLNEMLDDLKRQSATVADLRSQTEQAREEAAESQSKLGEEAKRFTSLYESAADAADQANKAAEDSRREADAVNKKLEGVRKNRKTRVIFVLDSSQSMAAGLRSARGNGMMLARTLPLALKHVEFGVITFHGETVDEFPLQVLTRKVSNGPTSLESLEVFFSAMKPVSGDTCVERVLTKAMNDLDQGSDQYGSEVLLLCADVGPGDLHGYERTAGDRVIAKVARWANQPNRNRRIVAIQTGRDTGDHQPFFEGLGSVNADSAFTTELASMFPLVFQAAFVGEGES